MSKIIYGSVSDGKLETFRILKHKKFVQEGEIELKDVNYTILENNCLIQGMALSKIEILNEGDVTFPGSGIRSQVPPCRSMILTDEKGFLQFIPVDKVIVL
jgi:hypothetical protein